MKRNDAIYMMYKNGIRPIKFYRYDEETEQVVEEVVSEEEALKVVEQVENEVQKKAAEIIAKEDRKMTREERNQRAEELGIKTFDRPVDAGAQAIYDKFRGAIKALKEIMEEDNDDLAMAMEDLVCDLEDVMNSYVIYNGDVLELEEN